MIRRFARPYAKALFELAGPSGRQSLLEELARFEAARRSSTELSDLMANPAVEHHVKSAITQQIASRLGLSQLATRTLDVLVKNHRINQLASIVEALRDLVNSASGVAVAEVRTAHKLGEDETANLRRSLEQRFGKKIDLELSVDAALLGGFVAKVGSEIYDASVVGQINKFRQSLR